MNKLGTFSLSQLGKSKSPIAEFMRNQRKNNDNFEESLLKLVRRFSRPDAGLKCSPAYSNTPSYNQYIKLTPCMHGADHGRLRCRHRTGQTLSQAALV